MEIGKAFLMSMKVQMNLILSITGPNIKQKFVYFYQQITKAIEIKNDLKGF